MFLTRCSQSFLNQLMKLFPLPPHHRSQHNSLLCHIVCQVYQMQIVSPHFFRSTLMLSYHLNIDFPNVLFVLEFTNKIIYVFVKHHYRSVSVLQNVAMWYRLYAVNDAQCRAFDLSFVRWLVLKWRLPVRYNQLLSDTTVADPPVLSHCVLLC